MIMRAAFRTLKDAPGLPADPEADAPSYARVSDRADPLVPDPAPQDHALVDVLRGLDLDALLAGAPEGDFLFVGGRTHASIDGFGEQVRPDSPSDLEIPAEPAGPLVLPGLPDHDLLGKDAGVAQVLPGVTDDDFLFLGKDADLPLVLPGEDEVLGMLDAPTSLIPGLSTDMLTLDAGEGGLRDFDAARLLHDHDDWLF